MTVVELKQMPGTGQITDLTQHVRTYFWVTLYLDVPCSVQFYTRKLPLDHTIFYDEQALQNIGRWNNSLLHEKKNSFSRLLSKCF